MNDRTQLAAIICLAVIALAAIGGTVYLSSIGAEPAAVLAVAASAVGAVAGALALRPKGDQ